VLFRLCVSVVLGEVGVWVLRDLGVGARRVPVRSAKGCGTEIRGMFTVDLLAGGFGCVVSCAVRDRLLGNDWIPR